MESFPLAERNEEAQDAPLAAWRANVGAPLSLDLSAEARSRSASLVVLSWNAWIGRGDIAGLVTRIRNDDFAALGFPADLPFVALIQEAYRADDSIPRFSNGSAARDFSRRGGHEHEIAHVARQLRLNLRYAPSMRNGPEQSDRGNAILSSLPLLDASAAELPFAFQRRVAVAASIVAGGSRIRLHSAHLDPRGAAARDLFGIAGRLRQARALLESIDAGEHPQLLGADLNLARQRREPAFRALMSRGFVTGVPPARIRWRHTYHRLPRLLLDWLLLLDDGRVTRFEVRRLDEHPRDTGPYVFGSDHHPLLARLDIETAAPEAAGAGNPAGTA